MNTPNSLSLVACVVLVAVHLAAGQVRGLHRTPRSRWLSFAGGVSVAYAILHLLGELAEHEDVLSATFGSEHAVFVLSLLGLVIFYGLEKLAIRSSQRESDEASNGTFWVHVGSFALYNVLLGYTLVQEARPSLDLLLLTVAFGLHLLVNDYALQQHHRESYRRKGRWVISLALLMGWAVGAVAQLPESVTAATVAFLAGGILLNTFKEELPRERESKFWTFAAGTLLYAALLLAI